MAKELYVGHISEQANEDDLRKLFSLLGPVTSVHLIVDQTTGEFKRCAYVRMLSEVNLDEVVETLDGTYLIDRCIVVSIAKPQKDRPPKTTHVRRKPTGGNKQSTTARTSDRNELPVEVRKSAKSSRPAAAKDSAKTGRSSAAKEALKNKRPVADRISVRSERPTAGKREGAKTHSPSKGRK